MKKEIIILCSALIFLTACTSEKNKAVEDAELPTDQRPGFYVGEPDPVPPVPTTTEGNEEIKNEVSPPINSETAPIEEAPVTQQEAELE